MNAEWTIPEDGGESGAGWTPYAGRRVRGRVCTVVIRGEMVVVDGQIVGTPGMGKNVRLHEGKGSWGFKNNLKCIFNINKVKLI